MYFLANSYLILEMGPFNLAPGKVLISELITLFDSHLEGKENRKGNYGHIIGPQCSIWYCVSWNPIKETKGIWVWCQLIKMDEIIFTRQNTVRPRGWKKIKNTSNKYRHFSRFQIESNSIFVPHERCVGYPSHLCLMAEMELWKEGRWYTEY